MDILLSKLCTYRRDTWMGQYWLILECTSFCVLKQSNVQCDWGVQHSLLNKLCWMLYFFSEFYNQGSKYSTFASVQYIIIGVELSYSLSFFLIYIFTYSLIGLDGVSFYYSFVVLIFLCSQGCQCLPDLLVSISQLREYRHLSPLSAEHFFV